MGWAPYALAGWLFIIGVYGVATSKNLVHMVVCLSVAQASTYVFLLEAGYRLHASAPIFKDVPQSTRFVDPVVQALVLTDIVIGLSVSALLLAIAIQLYKRRGSIDPNEPAAMAG